MHLTGGIAELITIALVGEIMHEAHAGTWFLLVSRFCKHLFKTLPNITRFLTIKCTYGHGRYYRIMRNLERIWADLALCLANTVDDDTTYSVDSKPIPICDLKRSGFPRAMTEARTARKVLSCEQEAIYGFSTMGGVWGFKLHAVVNNVQMLCRFAIVPANEADVMVARCLLNSNEDEFDRILGDKAYLGMGIFTPSRENAKKPLPWTRLMGAARKLIERE